MIEHESAKQTTGVSMNVIRNEFEQNKHEVINLLVENCIEVDCSIPRVVV